MSVNYFNFLLVITFVFLHTISLASGEPKDDIGKSVAELVKSRNFIAENHYITAKDGTILQATRVLNPLINRGKSGLSSKVPLILIHGAMNDGRCFVVNSDNGQPRDFSNRSVDDVSDQLRKDPVSGSIALLASSFGHEVWILNRRGTSGSRGDAEASSSLLSGDDNKITDSDSFDDDQTETSSDDLFKQLEIPFANNFWNYSLDEQTKYDFPAVIDYVLNKTSSNKTSVIGHSAGGAITLMALSTMPDIQDKLDQILLWAPALYLSKSLYESPSGLLSLINYNGPVPPPAAIALDEGFNALACRSKTVCSLIASTRLAIGGSYNTSQHTVARHLAYQGPTSSHELIQLGQSADKGKMYTYDYGSARRNQIAYGQDEPILYDVAKIKSTKLSFWYGQNDEIVQPEQVQELLNDLKVPYKERFFNDTGLDFEHESYFLLNNAAELVIIPAMKVIETTN